MGSRFPSLLQQSNFELRSCERNNSVSYDPRKDIPGGYRVRGVSFDLDGFLIWFSIPALKYTIYPSPPFNDATGDGVSSGIPLIVHNLSCTVLTCTTSEGVNDMSYMDIENLSMDELLKLLRHREIEIRWRAARALGSCGGDAVNPLIARLYDDDQNVRMLSIWSLGRIGDKRAIGPISRALHDPDTMIQIASEGALSRLRRT